MLNFKTFTARQSATKHRNATNGFTIIEQLVASTVLSVVLIIVSNGFMHILKMYYRTINQTKVQELTRSVADEVSDSIRFNSDYIVPTNFPAVINPDIPAGAADTGYMCIGSKRFSYAVDRELITALPDGSKKQKRHVLWVDEPPNCTTSANLNSPNPSANGKELLQQNMRLTRFQVSSINANTYRVDIGIALGDDKLLEVNGLTKNCVGSAIADSHFCAASNLSTVINMRLQ